MPSQERSTQTDRSLNILGQVFDLKFKDALKFISSLLLPLILGIFILALNFQQQDTARQQRELDRYLSEVDRNASQLQREEDRMEASIIRELERNLSDEKYQNERLDNYINAMAKLLKENNGSLTHNEVTANIARIKTLAIFRQLDLRRNIHVIRFLHEAKQLTEREEHLPLDLSTAQIVDIDFRDLAVNRKYFNNLFLTGVFLSNAKFTSIEMKHINFAHAQFNNVNFSDGHFFNINFTHTSFDNSNFTFSYLNSVNFSLAELSNINFSGARFENVDFSFARLKNIEFSSTQFVRVNLFSAELDNVNFSSFSPEHVEFVSTRLRNVDFSFAYLESVIFSNSFLFYCLFLSTTWPNMEIISTRFDNVKFPIVTFYKTFFVNSSFYNVDLSSLIATDTNFLSTQFTNINFSSSRLEGSMFMSVDFYNVRFSSIQFKDVNFSLAILGNIFLHKIKMQNCISASVKFNDANISGTHFHQTTTISIDFTSSNLSYSSFVDANLKRASFVQVDLTNVNFYGANLYKVNFTNTKIAENQLQNALSIQDALLPNGTIAHDKNFLNSSQADCNTSVGSSWILQTGNVTRKISNHYSDSCYFALNTYNTGATMFQHVNLSNKWNSKSWPYSYAVLSANMSVGVSIQFRGINNIKGIHTYQTLSKFQYISLVITNHLYVDSSGKNISLILDEGMQELEVFIEFSAVSGQSSFVNYWCDNIKLFIIYGTYMETSKGK